MEHIGTMRHRQDLNNVHPNSLLQMVKSSVLSDKFASFSDINRKMDATPDPNTGHVHYLDPTCDRFHGGLISIIDIIKQTVATPVFTGLVQTLDFLITPKTSTICFFTKSDEQKIVFSICLFDRRVGHNVVVVVVMVDAVLTADALPFCPNRAVMPSS